MLDHTHLAITNLQRIRLRRSPKYRETMEKREKISIVSLFPGAARVGFSRCCTPNAVRALPACPAFSCPALACLTLACPALACPALAFPAYSCLAFSCPALVFPAFSCPALAFPAFSCPLLALSGPGSLWHSGLVLRLRCSQIPSETSMEQRSLQGFGEYYQSAAWARGCSTHHTHADLQSGCWEAGTRGSLL